MREGRGWSTHASDGATVEDVETVLVGWGRVRQ